MNSISFNVFGPKARPREEKDGAEPNLQLLCLTRTVNLCVCPAGWLLLYTCGTCSGSPTSFSALSKGTELLLL